MMEAAELMSLARIAVGRRFNDDPAIDHEDLIQSAVVAILEAKNNWQGQQVLRARSQLRNQINFRASLVRRKQWRFAEDSDGELVGNARNPADIAEENEVVQRLQLGDGLTKAEHRTAMLALQGFDNREVADKLGVDIRTVWVRLKRVVEKYNQVAIKKNRRA